MKKLLIIGNFFLLIINYVSLNGQQIGNKKDNSYANYNYFQNFDGPQRHPNIDESQKDPNIHPGVSKYNPYFNIFYIVGGLEEFNKKQNQEQKNIDPYEEYKAKRKKTEEEQEEAIIAHAEFDTLSNTFLVPQSKSKIGQILKSNTSQSKQPQQQLAMQTATIQQAPINKKDVKCEKCSQLISSSQLALLSHRKICGPIYTCPEKSCHNHVGWCKESAFKNHLTEEHKYSEENVLNFIKQNLNK